MKSLSYGLWVLSLLFIGLLPIHVSAETFYLKGNQTPIPLDISQYEERNGSLFFQDDITLELPYKSLELVQVRGRLWGYEESEEVFHFAEFVVSTQDFFSQLYEDEFPLRMENRGEMRITLIEGNELLTRVPLKSKKRYLQLATMAGQYIGLGPFDMEMAILQSEMEMALGLDEATLIFSGALSGLGAFLSPISMAGIGLSTQRVFHFSPKTTFGLSKKVKKKMTFQGQLALVGSAGIPKLPVSLTGELVTEFSGPLVETRRQGFNGSLAASYKFSGELGLSLELGTASAYFSRPTLKGKKGPLEMTFSGVQDPTIPLLPKDFPLQPGQEMRVAGHMSSELKRSYFVAHTDYRILNIPLSEGRLNIDKKGVVASGFWKTPVSRIGFEGEVSKKKIGLKGKAQAKLDVNGVLKKVQWVTNAAICGSRYATSGAKCGYQFLSGKIRCATSKIPHAICMHNCNKQVQRRVGGPRNIFTCEKRCFLNISHHCKKAKKCRFPKRCKQVVHIPNSPLGHISADIALLISQKGLGGEVAAEFCPIKNKKCARLPAGQVKLDVSNIKKPKVCIGKGVAGSQRGLCVGF